MNRDSLVANLITTSAELCDCLLIAYNIFSTLDVVYINKQLKTLRFGNFTFLDVIGTRYGFEYMLDNFNILYRNPLYRKNLFAAVFILQSLRFAVNKPFIITSFFRCPLLNKLVQGVPNSLHQSALAFDIKRTEFVNKISLLSALDTLKGFFSLDSTPTLHKLINSVQVIEYNTYIHVEIEA